MEGPEGKEILLWWRSNFERSKLISSRNQFSRHDMQLGVELSQEGGSRFCGLKNIIISPNNRWFSEKPTFILNYCSGILQMSKNYRIWCLLGEDLAFRDFCGLNFQLFL